MTRELTEKRLSDMLCDLTDLLADIDPTDDKDNYDLFDDMRRVVYELLAYGEASKKPLCWIDPCELIDIQHGHMSKVIPSKELDGDVPLYTVPPIQAVIVPDEQQSDRFDWTFVDWCNHLGGRHHGNDPANYYEFGSFLAVAEMLRQFGNVQQKVGWNTCLTTISKSNMEAL